MPTYASAPDAVADPVNGLLVCRGRGGGAGARKPRKPKPAKRERRFWPESEAGPDVNVTDISLPEPTHARTADR